MRRSRRRAFEPGYTLMELVVSAMVALMVIAGLYVVYAVESRVFRGQEMVSQAQYAVRFASEIISADLQRAGYDGIADSANPQNVQRLCGTPAISPIQSINLDQSPAGPTFVSGTQYNDGGSPPQTLPDQLILTGNYANVDRYDVKTASGSDILLQNNTDSDPTDPFPTTADDFDAIFDPDNNKTLIRIRHNNKMFFSLLSGASYNSGTTPTITLAQAPACSEFQGAIEGAEVNVMQKVRYRVIPANLTAAEAAIRADFPGIDQRHDLVREYLDWSSGNVVGNPEVLAENVVDFQVWFLFDAGETPQTGPLAAQAYDFGLPETDSGTGNCSDGTIGTDSECSIGDILGAVFRLSVRTPHEDPDWLYVKGNPLFRYELDSKAKGSARVRTLFTQVPLPNPGYGL